MRNFIAILIFIYSASCNADLLPLPSDLADEVSILGSTLTDGHATFYPEYSKYIDLPTINKLGYGSGVAVLINIGGWAGGNTNNQYVAIYAINEKLDVHEKFKKYSLVSFVHIGGKGDRLFTDMTSKDGGIILTGFSYGEHDSLCCPTKPLTITLIVGERGVLELTANNFVDRTYTS